MFSDPPQSYLLQLYNWDFSRPRDCIVRQIDESVSHTTCRSHQRFVPSGHCFSRPLLLVISLTVRFVFLSLCGFVKIPCAFRSVCVMCFTGIDHHFFKSLLHSIGTGSTTLTTRTMQGSAVSLENVFVEIPSSRPHFRQLFCWTCINELITGSAKDKMFGVPRITNTNDQEFLVPGIASRESSRHPPR